MIASWSVPGKLSQYCKEDAILGSLVNKDICAMSGVKRMLQVAIDHLLQSD